MINTKIKINRWDWVLALSLALIYALGIYLASQLIPELILKEDRFDLWFQTDVPRVYKMMTERTSILHMRSNTHPLFSLIGFSLRVLVSEIFKVSPLVAVRIVMVTVAGLWTGSLYLLFRMLGTKRMGSLVLTGIGMVSAAGMFGFAVPETFGMGSLTILWTTMLVVLSETRPISMIWYFWANLSTLAITTTNWSAGILATWLGRSWKQALHIFLYTFSATTLLWGIQKFIFPHTTFFLDLAIESHFMTGGKESGGILSVFGAFFYHTLIMPAIALGANPYITSVEWPQVMLTQTSYPGSGTPWGAGAVVLWTGVLVLTFRNLIITREHTKVRIFLGLMILGQLLLHSVYGEETFLYSLHFIVLLLPAVALAFHLGPGRKFIAGFSIILLVCMMINNSQQFLKALDYFRHFGTERERLEVEMTLRRGGPWPRGRGHVVIGIPGTFEKEKAYHEPGGSFSPQVGSFGVSIWVLDRDGWLLASSETIPMDQIRQSFVDLPESSIPVLKTETPYYEIFWIAYEKGRWGLRLISRLDLDSGDCLAVVVRGPGPAGGPIHRVELIEQELRINHQWRLGLDPQVREIVLGDETRRDWRHGPGEGVVWENSEGWAFAKILLGESKSQEWTFTFENTAGMSSSETGLNYSDTRSQVAVNLPDERFEQSLRSQVAHMMMALVGQQTRPADPLHQPVSSHKDAAHIVAALANVGQLDVARQLSWYLAEHDFSGGLGPEADAPGLAIWALCSVANRLPMGDSDDYRTKIWPHIRRKAELILSMLDTEEPMYRSVPNPLLPSRRKESYDWINLLAQTAQKGLIIGRAESQIPILYVNATAYRGLMDAADFAMTLGETVLAETWKARADELRKAWEHAFFALKTDPIRFLRAVTFLQWEVKRLEANIDNYLTYSNGFWPSAIAWGSVQKDYAQDLAKRWEPFRNDPAEIHQWLFLNEPDRVWNKLQWFWRPETQDSPGLYTWWEGKGEENTFPGWESVRGGVRPKAVAPQYGVAARMIMLQLNMLAVLDPAQEDPIVIIGSGIPKEWILEPMEVKGIQLPGRIVDWEWDGEKMRVRITGQKAEVRLGPAFPEGTKIEFVEEE